MDKNHQADGEVLASSAVIYKQKQAPQLKPQTEAIKPQEKPKTIQKPPQHHHEKKRSRIEVDDPMDPKFGDKNYRDRQKKERDPMIPQ